MGVTNLDEFERELDQVFKVTVQEFTKKAVALVVKDAYRVITRDSRTVGFEFGSPVLSGQYYTNHNISLNTIDQSVRLVDKSSRVEGDDSPLSPLPLQNADEIMKQWKPGDTVFIANSVDYSGLIEGTDGSPPISRFKAPEGVYRVAAEFIKLKFQRVTVVEGGFVGG